MKCDPVVVLGAGGHAKVIIELLRGMGYDVVKCVSSHEQEAILGVPVVTPEMPELRRLRRDGVTNAFIAIGSNAVRRALANTILELDFKYPNAIGRSAVISPSATLGFGIAVMEGAVVNACVTIGNHAIINTNASIDHDCNVREFCHVAPGCTLAGTVSVGAHSFLGARTVAIPGVKMPEHTTTGAGTVVVRDLEAPGTYVGTPARRIKLLE